MKGIEQPASNKGLQRRERLCVRSKQEHWGAKLGVEKKTIDGKEKAELSIGCGDGSGR